MTQPATAIIGAGPAGLTAAHELVRHGRPVTVYEAGGDVGGIARTEQYKGYRFDIGGHRFYTKAPEVQALWESMLGDEFIRVRRLSRIYYRGRFYDYPLKVFNVLGNLGLIEAGRILASYAAARLRPIRDEQSFEDWVTNRFGSRLFRTFFKTYTEKVWGIPCSEIRADWAAQRIRELSFASAVIHAITGRTRSRTLIDSFQYPRLGPGQMWDAFTAAVRSGGGSVQLNSSVTTVRRRGKRITGIVVSEDGRERETPVDHLISTMPLTALLRCMDPAPPDEVLAAAAGLKYRDFLIVTLIIDRPELFPDNWIYIHSPEVRVGRIQNFRNWSADMVPDPRHTSLGMEYFCSAGDDLWQMDDAKLIELARREVQTLGLARSDEVIYACVIRQPKAYPVYDASYRAHLDVLRGYLDTFENLYTIGRNGMHRYNNQDHSMLCGLYAARNVLGARYDLWDVNTDRSYYEEQELPATGATGAAGGAGETVGAANPEEVPLVDVSAATEALIDVR